MKVLWDTLRTIVHWVYGLDQATGSIKNYLNVAELLRVVVPALLHGGGVFAALAAVIGSADAIFAPPYAAAVVAVLTAVWQVARFLGQGVPAPKT